MTEEQRRAMALAAARQRQAQAQQQAPSTTDPAQAANAAQPGQSPLDLMRQSGMAGMEGSGQPRMDMMNPVQGDPTGVTSAVDAVRDQVIGTDNGVMSAGEKIGTALNMAGESLTFGLVGDEAAAGADALIGRGGTYGENLERYRGQERQFEQENPALALGARVAPAFIPGAGAASFIGRASSLGGAAARSAAVGGAGGATYGFMEGEGGVEDRARGAAVGGGVGAALGGVIPYAGAALRALTGGSQRAANRAATESVETVDDLRAMATAKYTEAQQLGITATQEQTQRLASNIGDIARREGLITPTGRVAGSYPRINDALNMVDDFAQGTMTPEQMQAVRRTFQAAAGSTDGAERRLGTIMLDQFDRFVAPLAPQFREANQLYRRAMNGQLIDEAVELAGVRAGQFTGSGFENALRTEFRRLSRDIVKGRLKGLTQDQQSSIRRIANGAPMENFLRGLGKAAPTGVVSAGIGGGMPFLVGNAIGGPGVGAAMGGATMAVGGLARNAATRMGIQNANVASGVMRSADGVLPRVNALAAPSVSGAAIGGAAAIAPELERRQR